VHEDWNGRRGRRTNMVNGSEGVTARCVTHPGHSPDGMGLVASHRGRDRDPTMYIYTL